MWDASTRRFKVVQEEYRRCTAAAWRSRDALEVVALARRRAVAAGGGKGGIARDSQDCDGDDVGVDLASTSAGSSKGIGECAAFSCTYGCPLFLL
jgi:hypothetical protein